MTPRVGSSGIDSSTCIADGRPRECQRRTSVRSSAETASITRCILPCKSLDGSPQRTANPPKKGEEDRNDVLHLFLHHFLHPGCSEVFDRESNRNAARRKDAVEKTPNRAGATPLFRPSAAQVNRGVAPALRHR